MRVERNGERRKAKRLWTGLLFVVGMGFGALLKEQIPELAHAQQPNVAVRESSSLATRVAVLEERLRGLDIALQLQAAKYEDRLNLLNNSHEIAVRVQAANKDLFVSKDEFKGAQAWREQAEKRLTTIEAGRIGASSFNAQMIVYILLFIAIVGMVLNWMQLRKKNL